MIALASVKNGDSGTVAALKTNDESTIRKLMAMGVIPGMPIVLEQRFPSYIIKVGKTRAAIDHEIAQTIYIKKKAS